MVGPPLQDISTEFLHVCVVDLNSVALVQVHRKLTLELRDQVSKWWGGIWKASMKALSIFCTCANVG